MHTTSPTLLQKLREPDSRVAWDRFVDLYTPLLLAWARRTGLQDHDAADLVQEVFLVLLRKLPEFQYDPARRNFRGWLRTVCLNKWRDRQRLLAANMPQAGEAAVAELEASDDGLQEFWDREHHAFLVRQALMVFEGLECEFEPRTLQICREVVIHQRPIKEVAMAYRISENSVYIAKMRVLRRLRQALSEFLD